MKIWLAIKTFLIKSIKANLGINGEEDTYDPGGSVGEYPEGMGEALAVDLYMVLFLYWMLDFTPEDGLKLIYVMVFWGFMIIFGFSLIKKALGIRFPAGDGFHPWEIMRR